MSETHQKYTLSLPVELYEDLREKAEKHDRSIKEVVRQCLKFGLIGMEIAEDPNAEIVFRERIPVEENGNRTFETRDKYVKFLW
ncbi:MAG: hypothetical protein ACE5JU_10375 [Candidatus Binatia bacterium]